MAAALEQREQRSVMGDRLVERVVLASLVAGPQEVGHGAVLVLGREPVVGEHPEHLVEVCRVLLLEPFGCLPVQRSSRLREDRAVGGLLDQRVPEAVLGLGPAARLPDELEPLELVQRVLRRGSEHAFEERQPERPAKGRGRGEDVVARRREAVDPREQELFDRRRDLHRDVVVEAVTARLADERARLEERADELLEVEGIPLGLAEHAGGDVVGERLGPHERVEQRGLRVARQGLEHEFAGQVRILAQRQLAQAPGCVVALVPLGDHEQDRSLLGEAEELLAQLHRGRVGPMQVLERHHDRPVGGKAAQNGRDDLEGLVLERLRGELGQLRRGVRLERQAEERAQVRVDLVAALREESVDVTPQRDPQP